MGRAYWEYWFFIAGVEDGKCKVILQAFLVRRRRGCGCECGRYGILCPAGLECGGGRWLSA